MIRDYWFWELGSSVVLEFLFVLPGVLFLVCWALSREKRQDVLEGRGESTGLTEK
jgi:type IV secretory pathway TrbL component